MKTVSFSQMKDGTQEDYDLLEPLEHEYIAQLPQRLLAALEDLANSLSGYKINRLEHSLQSATLAWRSGADIDWVVCALLHDIGDGLAPYSHDKLAAEIVRPFVREQCTWVVENHFDFQKYYFNHFYGGNRNVREKHQGNPYYDDCVDFCELWDQAAFNPDYANLPLSFFAPMLESVFTRKPFQDAYVQAGVRLPLVDTKIAQQRNTDNDATVIN